MLFGPDFWTLFVLFVAGGMAATVGAAFLLSALPGTRARRTRRQPPPQQEQEGERPTAEVHRINAEPAPPYRRAS